MLESRCPITEDGVDKLGINMVHPLNLTHGCIYELVCIINFIDGYSLALCSMNS